MSGGQRRGGIITVAVAGVTYDCKGSFSYNLGVAKREAIMGSGRVTGYKESPQVAFIEGEFTDRGDLDVAAMLRTVNATVTLRAANGKTIMLKDAWQAGDGTVQTEEGNIGVRFESEDEAQEVS